ncbi:MAG: asparagine synthase (glutamine-hydrolyzing) [Armatimonadetes bacterium]|nr:MAG: asparagine synthase (glutamine-hydrolyzing) [Armatimonadota bacterium]
MCGIAGIISIDRPLGDVRDQVLAMVGALRHRGPDDTGLFAHPRAVLGMARLSVIDLQGGKQPIANETGRVCAVQNGEIYNYRELRNALSARGHRFQTQSDTEVLVHAYEEYGLSFPEKLTGMYAVAIWDSDRERLVLTRDRLGEKPLFFAYAHGCLLFASEMKALMRTRADLDLTVDAAALDEYLSFGFVSAPQTIYLGIRKLAPGHTLVVEDGQIKITRYWVPDLRPPAGRNEAEITDEIEELVERSVRRQMNADVPLGAFLSGGIDSSVVVAMMRKVSNGPIRTFTIGFDDSAFDERDPARTVARHLGTTHEELVLDPDIAEILPRLVAAFDEPFGDKSVVPTYFVANLARQHVKVALSGDGGDEVFGGYLSYMDALHKERRAKQIPASLRPVVRRMWHVYPSGAPAAFRLRKRGYNAQDRFVASSFVFDPDAKRQLLCGDVRAKIVALDPLYPKARHFVGCPTSDLLTAIQWNDLHHYLPDDILAKVDRMTMLNSLESRAPLLDHTLVEHGLGLPRRYKIWGHEAKVALRKVAARYLPQEILTRPKQGFGLPVKAWLSTSLARLVEDTVLGSPLRSTGWFRQAALERLVRQNRHTAAGPSNRLWLLLCLGLWLEGSARC